MDEILHRLGLKYEDLTFAEKDTLQTWTKSLEQKKLTIEIIKEYVSGMRFAVERELTQIGHNSKQDIFLKARLRNYILLEGFLESPEKARKALDQAVAGLVSNVKAK